jgi:hypothetical protein
MAALSQRHFTRSRANTHTLTHTHNAACPPDDDDELCVCVCGCKSVTPQLVTKKKCCVSLDRKKLILLTLRKKSHAISK